MFDKPTQKRKKGKDGRLTGKPFFGNISSNIKARGGKQNAAGQNQGRPYV
jgi:hypothetical protein